MMKNDCHYSIISYINNSLSKESIAIGLSAICDGKIFLKFSEKKIDFAKKLNPASAKILEFSIKQFKKFVSSDIETQDSSSLNFEKIYNVDFLNRISSYNNNILQFSKPSYINLNFDEITFNQFFNKYIGSEEEVVQKNAYTPFKLSIANNFYNPLKDKIDIDYTVKKESLPTLISDFHLDGIGINGAMYAAKSIDINSKQLSYIKDTITGYESFIVRLNHFAESRNIKGVPEYFLIADPYIGNTLSYIDLYSILSKENMPFFKLISTSDLPKIVNMMIDRKVRKFSDELAIAV